MANTTVLYVDDERNNLFSFKATFRTRYNILTAISAEEALSIVVSNSNIDVIISDQRMPGTTGVQLFEKLYELKPDIIRILVTGYADIAAVIEAINRGKIFHYLTKPWSEEEIILAIERGIVLKKSGKLAFGEQQRLSIQNELLEDQLKDGTFFNKTIKISDKLSGVLNIKRQAREFADILKSLSFEEGMMVGIFGRWGRGKTFFWKNVWKNLEVNFPNHFFKAEFHAWKYQDTPASWAYLYEVLTTTFLDKPKSFIPSLWRRYVLRMLKLNFKRKGVLPLLKFLIIVLSGTISFFGLKFLALKAYASSGSILTWYIGLPLASLITIYELAIFYKKEYSASAKDLFLTYTKKHSFKDHLGIQAEIQKEIVILLKVWIDKKSLNNKRVLIFVDDIDRCNENKIMEIIDSLRIMLDNPEISQRLIVLTAVDERVLKRVISNKYFDIVSKDFDDSKELKKMNLTELINEYMDKLFILGVKLNNLNQPGRIQILQSITENKIKYKTDKIETIDGKKFLRTTDELIAFENVKTKVRTIDIETEVQDLEYKNDDPRDLEIDEEEYNALVDIVSKYNNATPRTIRIFYYRFLLAKRFLMLDFNLDRNLKKEWDKYTDPAILPYIIADCTLKHSVSKDNLEIIFQTEDFWEINILNKPFTIKPTVLDELLKIAEIVIPY